MPHNPDKVTPARGSPPTTPHLDRPSHKDGSRGVVLDRTGELPARNAHRYSKGRSLCRDTGKQSRVDSQSPTTTVERNDRDTSVLESSPRSSASAIQRSPVQRPHSPHRYFAARYRPGAPEPNLPHHFSISKFNGRGRGTPPREDEPNQHRGQHARGRRRYPGLGRGYRGEGEGREGPSRDQDEDTPGVGPYPNGLLPGGVLRYGYGNKFPSDRTRGGVFRPTPGHST